MKYIYKLITLARLNGGIVFDNYILDNRNENFVEPMRQQAFIFSFSQRSNVYTSMDVIKLQNPKNPSQDIQLKCFTYDYNGQKRKCTKVCSSSSSFSPWNIWEIVFYTITFWKNEKRRKNHSNKMSSTFFPRSTWIKRSYRTLFCWPYQFLSVVGSSKAYYIKALFFRDEHQLDASFMSLGGGTEVVHANMDGDRAHRDKKCKWCQYVWIQFELRSGPCLFLLGF